MALYAPGYLDEKGNPKSGPGSMSVITPPNQEIGANGWPVEPTPAQPINRSVDTVSPAESYLNTFTPPESPAQIAERKRKESAGLIDSINSVYEIESESAKQRGRERLQQNNALSIFSGMAGSPDAQGSRDRVNTANEKEVVAINAKRVLHLESIYREISREAETEARQQLEDATRSAEEIVARKTANQEKAVANLKLMASGGLVDFESFKGNPQNAGVYNHALEAVGGSEEALRGLFAINRPQEQLVGTPTRVGNSYVQAYKNPITGKVSFEQLALPVDLPTEYKNFQKLGDNIVAIPDGWDGDTSKLVTIAGQKSTQDQLNEDKTRAEIAKLEADTAKTAAEAAQTRKELAGSLGVDENTIAYAQQYAATGKIPTGLPKGTFGKVAQVAKELPKAEGTLIDKTTGVKPDISDAQLDGLAALYDIRRKVEQLKELDEGRWHGVIAGSLGKVFGSEAQQRYIDLRSEIVDLLARARTGAALTIQEEKFYASKLPGRLAEPLRLGTDPATRIENFTSSIDGTIRTKLDAKNVAIVGFSKVKIGNQEYPVGEVISNDTGQQGRVNADGSITVLNE